MQYIWIYEKVEIFKKLIAWEEISTNNRNINFHYVV